MAPPLISGNVPSARAAGYRDVRVLVVEDESAIRWLMTEILEDEGYEVRGAEDGLAALDVLEGWTPDVILLDMRMPRMDGAEFLRARRERAAASRVPVIVLSASRHIAVEGLGVNRVLGKPFEVEGVLEALRACLLKSA